MLPRAKQHYNKCLDRAKIIYKGGRIKNYKVGEEIMYKNYRIGENWEKGIIIQKLSPVTYIVKNINNITCKRLRDINK